MKSSEKIEDGDGMAALKALEEKYMLDELSPEQIAYEKLQKYRKCSDVEMDYKAEIQQALEEKYVV